MKTFGQLLYHLEPSARRGTWVIAAEPHVTIRAKRFLTRVRTNRAGNILISDTPEVARDIQWFTDRYPLAMDDVTAQRLRHQADAHRARENAVQMILEGQTPRDYGLREPARPARPYQELAAQMAIATGRLLITDDVGLGKTTTGALVLRADGALPALVVTLTHLPGQWEREINTVLPWLKTHIVRKGQPYDPMTVRGVTAAPDVLIMGYSKLAGWADHLAGDIKTVIFDEMQELRHDGTRKHTAAAQISDAATYRVGLTATPVYNYGIEAFNVISVLTKDSLGTREEFIREWCTSDNYVNPGKVLVRNPAALGAYLRDEGLMLGRTRKEVGRELPDAIPVVQTIESDPAVIDRVSGDAAEMARLILDRSGARTERFVAAGQLDMMMRQATGVAKAPFVAAFVRLLLESEDRVVLYGWHREVYDLWLAMLAVYNPVLYTGTERPTQKAENAERFMTGDSRVLIMSLRSGAGLDGLQKSARVVVFGELDWSPQVHEQCIGRLRRDGQDEADPVIAYYLVAEDGSDPAIAEVLQVKRNQAEPMLSKDGRLFTRPAADTDRTRMLAEAVLSRLQPTPGKATAPAATNLIELLDSEAS